jgi:hypothetical protein
MTPPTSARRRAKRAQQLFDDGRDLGGLAAQHDLPRGRIARQRDDAQGDRARGRLEAAREHSVGQTHELGIRHPFAVGGDDAAEQAVAGMRALPGDRAGQVVLGLRDRPERRTHAVQHVEPRAAELQELIALAGLDAQQRADREGGDGHRERADEIDGCRVTVAGEPRHRVELIGDQPLDERP